VNFVIELLTLEGLTSKSDKIQTR